MKRCDSIDSAYGDRCGDIAGHETWRPRHSWHESAEILWARIGELEEELTQALFAAGLLSRDPEQIRGRDDV
jgi:hypothetical protein